MTFTEEQIKSLAPDDSSLRAGKVLSARSQWLISAQSGRAIWGEIKGTGSKPYQTQVDINNVAFKCSCPSRKFPCKHGIGLLLLSANDPSAVSSDEEPSWVAEWMDKRQVKAEKAQEPPKELTEEIVAKAEKSKQKRADDRASSVQSGVDEINLWISDIIRTGIIQLAQKDHQYFAKIAARMVDAKASGLAGWIKSLGKIDYTADSRTWQNEALITLSKMHLLTNAYGNLNQLDTDWQHTIRSLIGYSQSPKDLLADESAIIHKDVWLVAGQETTTEDDITVQRSWLVGIQTGKTALILNFGTRFAPMDVSVVKGSIIEAGISYFPSIWPQRAVIKLQNKFLDYLPINEKILPNFQSLYEHITATIALYPFATDIVSCLSTLRPFNDNGIYKVIDSDGFLMELHVDFNAEKVINWLAVSGGNFFNMAVVVRDYRLIPLGIFNESKYTLL